MPQIHSLKTSPTYDLTDFHVVTTDIEHILRCGALLCESTMVFGFDQVYALVIPRSRVLRLDKIESELVATIACAVIDAGFNGKLVWKIVLTPAALETLKALRKKGCVTIDPNYLEQFKSAQQIMLFACPSGNYYQGSNQTDLQTDIVFCS